MAALYKNRYKILEETFTNITRMDEKELAVNMDRNYTSWITNVELKKKDPEINMVREKKQNLAKEIAKDPKIVELKEQLKQLVFEKTSEEKAKLDEELKNLSADYNADINSFKNLFFTCADLKTKRVIQE